MSVESGEWKGEYYDVNGFRGTLRLRIEGDDDVKGMYELVVVDEDEPLELSGSVTGEVEDGRVVFEVRPFAESKEPIRHTAEIRSAGSYARQALMGTVDPVKQLNFGGGVWIAWRFGRQDEGGR